MLSNVDDFLDCSNKENELLLSIIEITRNENDKLPIYLFNVNIKGHLTKTKAKLLLKQMGICEKVLNNTRCYVGIVVKQQ